MAHFVLASGNRHKLAEFQRILVPHRVVAMPDGITLPPEHVSSFAENARDKAAALARALAAAGDPATPASAPDAFCLADDSGLEVEALGWRPGVISSRYAGREGDAMANIVKLLAELEGRAGPGARKARFVCALDAVTADRRHFAVTGEWWGAIALAPRGNGGFGYDPVFVPDGEDQTVAELPQVRKDRLSHRARAAQALLQLLRTEGVLSG